MSTEEIKSKVNILDLISDVVDLKSSGTSHKGLCPFHQENTPSFVVYPGKGTWTCFGSCASSGDHFEFLMKKDGISFREAYIRLAEIANIPINSTSTNTQEIKVPANKFNSLIKANEAASKYFRDRLFSGLGKEVKEYLENRGIDMETSVTHGLGFAPDAMDTLADYLKNLKNRKFDSKSVIEAGLIKKTDSGWSDVFRNRLTVEIRNKSGEIIGFGGRRLNDNEKSPKYLNTKETEVFVKSSVLYGIDLAYKSILDKSQIIIVEGYMDVIAAHQKGYKNVVACMGTSINPKQLQYIYNIFTHNDYEIILCLDSDDAGVEATRRNLEVVMENFPSGLENNNISVVTLSGKDPDEVIRNDINNWKTSIDNSISLFDYYISTINNNKDVSVRENSIKKSLYFIKQHVSFTLQDSYLQKLSKITEINEDTLRAISQTLTSNNAPNVKNIVDEVIEIDKNIHEKTLLSIILKNNEVKDLVTDIPADYFSDMQYRTIFQLWFSDEIDTIYDLKDDVLVQKYEIVKNFNLADNNLNNNMAIIEEEKKRMGMRYLKKIKKEIIAEIGKVDDDEELNRLLERLVEIDKQINTIMSGNAKKNK
jgi:DNA primase